MAAPIAQGRDNIIGLSVEVKKGPKTLVSSLKTFYVSDTLQDVFNSFSLEDTTAHVIRAEASDRASGPWRQVGLDESVSMLASFNSRHIVFWLTTQVQVEEPVPVQEEGLDAIEILMTSASKIDVPSKRPASNNKNKMFNDIVDFLQLHDVGWRGAEIETEGAYIVQVL